MIIFLEFQFLLETNSAKIRVTVWSELQLDWFDCQHFYFWYVVLRIRYEVKSRIIDEKQEILQRTTDTQSQLLFVRPMVISRNSETDPFLHMWNGEIPHKYVNITVQTNVFSIRGVFVKT